MITKPQYDLENVEAVPIAMRFWWKRMLHAGFIPDDDRATYIFLDQLITGGDHDSKHRRPPVHPYTRTDFIQAVRALEPYYGRAEILRRTSGPAMREAWMYDPYDPTIHDIEVPMNLRGNQRVYMSQPGLFPMTRVRYGPIPDNPAMQYLVVEFGLGRIERQFDIVTFKIHWTAIPNGRYTDMRMDERTNSWQRAIAWLDSKRGIIQFPPKTYDLLSQPIAFSREAGFHTDFAYKDILRAIRMCFQRSSVDFTAKEKEQMTEGGTIGDAIMTDEAIDTIKYLVLGLRNKPYRTLTQEVAGELSAELGVCAIRSPAGFLAFLRRSDVYTLLNGFSDFKARRYRRNDTGSP